MANKTGPTRLGFALLLKFFQYAARFPLSMREVPTTVVAYIARQVGVPAEEFSRYDWKWLTSRNGKNRTLVRREFSYFRTHPTRIRAPPFAGFWLSSIVSSRHLTLRADILPPLLLFGWAPESMASTIVGSQGDINRRKQLRTEKERSGALGR